MNGTRHQDNPGQKAELLKVLLFDIDGTLLHASPCGRLAFQDALCEVTGVDDCLEDISFHGQTDPIIWRRICAKHGLVDSEDLEKRFYAIYEQKLEIRLREGNGGGRLCPGIPELLEKLSSRPDIFLSILTGNIEYGANAKLKAFGLDRFFHRGAYGSDHGDRNMLGPIAMARASAKTGIRIRPDQCWVIGDTPWDIACGKALGGRTLGVCTGSFKRDQLIEAGADRVLEDLSDMHAFTEVMELS
jgi:phosphoglycolate phosphatase-like HAD superfamily hydrolase